MKKKLMILLSVIALTLTAACATNTQAEKEKPEPSYYPIIDSGVGQHQRSPNAYVMVNKHGSMWLLNIDGVQLDTDLKTLEGACVYGVLQWESKGANIKEIHKLTKCPE